MWHAYGCDKLNPSGLVLSRCADGFSWKVFCVWFDKQIQYLDNIYSPKRKKHIHYIVSHYSGFYLLTTYIINVFFRDVMDKSNVLYVKSVNKEEGGKQCNYNFCQPFLSHG